jgi:DNA-binding MarR family transcriptional regulator
MQFLEYVHRYPAEICTVSAIAREFDLTKATVSDSLRALEVKGLVFKEKEESDRRTSFLGITAEGKRIAKRLSRWHDPMLSVLPEGQKEGVLLFLMRLISSFFTEGVLSVPRVCIACAQFKWNQYPSSAKPHLCSLTGKRMSDADLNIGCSRYSAPYADMADEELRSDEG